MKSFSQEFYLHFKPWVESNYCCLAHENFVILNVKTSLPEVHKFIHEMVRFLPPSKYMWKQTLNANKSCEVLKTPEELLDWFTSCLHVPASYKEVKLRYDKGRTMHVIFKDSIIQGDALQIQTSDLVHIKALELIICYSYMLIEGKSNPNYSFSPIIIKKKSHL